LLGSLQVEAAQLDTGLGVPGVQLQRSAKTPFCLFVTTELGVEGTEIDVTSVVGSKFHRTAEVTFGGGVLPALVGDHAEAGMSEVTVRILDEDTPT
jgi:hypothetical protein